MLLCGVLKQKLVSQFVSSRFVAFTLTLGAATWMGLAQRIDTGDITTIVSLLIVAFFGVKGIEWFKKPAPAAAPGQPNG